jgi:Iron-containing redox enzyme
MLPDPRGPLTAVLLHELRQQAHRLPPIVLPHAPDPIADEDVQLALYVLYELHYRGFEGVDERWEWEASLLALRGVLEDIFEGGLLRAIGPPDDEPGVDPQDLDMVLRGIADAEDEPSLSRRLERDATREQFAEFAIHRSAYQLKGADPHTWAIPRLWGPPKAALAGIQAGEYGGGDAARTHAELFGQSMQALGLDRAYGAYLDAIPAVTLATVNLMSLMGLHRRWRGGLVGHLALLELTSSMPKARCARGLRRLGLAAAAPFFDEHAEDGAVRENIAAAGLAGGLARQEPELTGQIIWGARAAVAVDARWSACLLDCWDRGVSSLRGPVPSRAPA